jgi:hypothetical protein
MEGSSLLVEEIKVVNKYQKLLESQQYIYVMIWMLTSIFA